MDPKRKAQVEQWIASGTITQKRHARYLLMRDSQAVDKPTESNHVSVKYPPLLKQAGNAIASAGRAFAFGFRCVDQVEQDRRLAICRACELFDPRAGRCQKCGCYAVWKTKLAGEQCPDDPPKW